MMMAGDNCLKNEEMQEVHRTCYSTMVPISPDFFLVNRRLSVEKLLRLESRLLEVSEKVLMEVGGRLRVSDIFVEREL